MCTPLQLLRAILHRDSDPLRHSIKFKRGMYQPEVDVDMLNAIKSLLADVSSVSPSSEQRMDYGLGESLYRVRAH